MTAQERKRNSVAAEIEKLEAQLIRRKTALDKRVVIAERVGMNITREEWYKVRDTVTEEQDDAYFRLSVARGEYEETEGRLKKARARLEKSEREVKIIVDRRTAEERERDRAAEIKKWAEDGITVKVISSSYITGITPSGKHFTIDGNNGFTERSRHCFTLTIDGKMIFSSGEFYRAYGIVKRS